MFFSKFSHNANKEIFLGEKMVSYYNSHIVKKIVFLLLKFTLISIAIAGLFLLFLRSQPLPIVVKETSYILANDGTIIDVMYEEENRQYVTLDNIPLFIQQATIAVEDKNFYQHNGFDFPRILKSLWIDLKFQEKLQGASTITQQLAKNLFYTHEKIWKRKFLEAIKTIQIELNFSKDKILEMYLNQIYYGHSASGVATAAKVYFGKELQDLNEAEMAMLVGIPKGPSIYSPLVNFNKAKERQLIVLKAMANEGYISKERMMEIYQTPLVLSDQKKEKKVRLAPYFTDYVREQLIHEYGFREKDLLNNGFKIYTTLDLSMQKIAENTVKQYLPKQSDLQAALIAIEPETGYIKAIVGGKDYKKNQFNRALYAKRQPGSTFKPFLYLAALENGITSINLVKSEPTVFTYDGEKRYIPKNYGDNYAHKFITMREAIKKSDNIYAVTTHLNIGMDKLVTTANALGIEEKLDPIPSLALGSVEVTPFEMVQAYSTIANLGVKTKPISILKIEDANGKVIIDNRPEKEQVASANATYILINLMQSIFEPGGTANRVANMLTRPVAGKTGTTDYDAWFNGFTPQLATTVWIGYDNNKELSPIEARLAAPIWAEFMEKALKNYNPVLFPVPQGIVAAYIDPENGLLATENCPNPQLELFITGTEPKEFCSTHLPKEEKIPQREEKPKQNWWQNIFKWWNK